MGGIGGAVRGLLRADGPGPWREMLSALVREQTRLRKPRVLSRKPPAWDAPWEVREELKSNSLQTQ